MPGHADGRWKLSSSACWPEMDIEQDCLRLYRLADSKGCEVREHGKFKATDFDAPLVL